MPLKAILWDTQNAYSTLSNLIAAHADRWAYRPAVDRWTFSEHAEHLWLAGLSIASVLKQEETFLQKFPALTREAKSFDELKQEYMERITAGMKAFSKQIPPKDLDKSAAEFQQQWNALFEKTRDRLLSAWTPERLSLKTVPHPALGNISVRELLFFQEFHIDHHISTLENEYL